MEFLADEYGVIREEAYRFTSASADALEDAAPAQAGIQSCSKTNVTAAARPAAQRNVLPSYKTRGYTKQQDAAQVLPLSTEFASSPPTVLFPDFQEGQSYTAQLRITNTSPGFSTFRMMAVPPKIRDAVSIEYEFPSRIPAGLSWPVKIVFTPKSNQNITDVLYLRTEAGAVPITFSATTSRAVISVITECIEFGTLAIGETKTVGVVLKNTGTLGDTVFIGGTFQDLLKELHTNPVTGEKQPYVTVYPVDSTVYVRPHSERRINIVFAPLQECELDCAIIFSVEDGNHSTGAAFVPVHISGRSTGLPVYVADADINFMWCFYGETYYQQVHIINTSNVSAHVISQIPAALRDVLRCDPLSMTVQPGSVYEATLFFTPTAALGSRFDSLIEFQVRNQALPSFVTISADLTTPEFSISTAAVNFGTFFLNDEKIAPLVVTNNCAILQKVAFNNLPPFASVTPDAATLLPSEEFTFTLRVRASQPGPVAATITASGKYGSEKSIRVAGVAALPSLMLSESTIKLPVCAVDGRVAACAVLTNTSHQTREFAFRSPSNFIKVSPSTGVVKPGDSVPFALLLSPQFNIDADAVAELPVVDLPRQSKAKKSCLKISFAADEAVVARSRVSLEAERTPDFTSWEEHSTPDAKSWHRTVPVCCASWAAGTEESVHVHVRCTIVEPTVRLRALTFSTDAAPPGDPTVTPRRKYARGKREVLIVESASKTDVVVCSNASTRITLEFGDVGINTTTARVFAIRNAGRCSTALSISPPWCSSTFFITRPLQLELAAHEEDAVVMEFNPKQFGFFSEMLKITADGSDLIVVLRGTCSEASVTFNLMEAPRAADGSSDNHDECGKRIVFGPTMVNDHHNLGTVLTNSGAFPVKTTVVPAPAAAVDECVATQTFFCHPSLFEIPPSGKATTTFSFNPRHPGNHEATVRVDAGNFSRLVTLVGFCTATSVYLILPGGRGAIDYSHGVRVSPHLPRSMGLSASFPLQLRFLRGESKLFTLGSVRDGPAFECFVHGWHESFTAAGWELGTSSLSVTSGQEAQIAISLKVPGAATQELAPYCSFALVIHCLADSSNDRSIFVSCTGP